MLNLNDTKAVISTAKAAADKLDSMAKAATQLAKEGKALNDIQAVLNGVEAFGKASFVLGIFVSGLDFILQLAGGPSPDQKIMNMIDNVSSQITSLSKVLQNRLDQLQAFDDYIGANNLSHPAFSHMDALFDDIQIYKDNLLNKKDTSEIEDKILLNYPPLQANAQSLTNLCLGVDGPDVLDKSYTYFHGDVNHIMGFGISVLHHLVFALLVEGVYNNIYYRRNTSSEEEFNEKFQQASSDTKKIYMPKINKVYTAVQSMKDKCTKNATANLILKSKKELFPKLDLQDYTAASKSFTQELQKQWFWLDFVAIIYDPVRGYQNHAAVSIGSHQVAKLWMGVNAESTLVYPEDKLSEIPANVHLYWNDRQAKSHKVEMNFLAIAISTDTFADSITCHKENFYNPAKGDYSAVGYYVEYQDRINPMVFMKQFLGNKAGPVPAAIWAAAPSHYNTVSGGAPGDGVKFGYNSTNPDRIAYNQIRIKSNPNVDEEDLRGYKVIYMS